MGKKTIQLRCPYCSNNKNTPIKTSNEFYLLDMNTFYEMIDVSSRTNMCCSKHNLKGVKYCLNCSTWLCSECLDFNQSISDEIKDYINQLTSFIIQISKQNKTLKKKSYENNKEDLINYLSSHDFNKSHNEYQAKLKKSNWLKRINEKRQEFENDECSESNITLEKLPSCTFSIIKNNKNTRLISYDKQFTIDDTQFFDQQFVRCLLGLKNNKFATGSLDCTITIWNIANSKDDKTLIGHHAGIHCLTELMSGKLASGSQDFTIKIWDISHAQCISTLIGHSNRISCLMELPNGSLASGSWDQTVKIWENKTFKCIDTLIDHTNAINCFLRLLNGEIGTGSSDNSIKVWSKDLSQRFICNKTLKGHTDIILALIQINNYQLISSSRDCLIKTWDLHSLQCIVTINAYTHPVNYLVKLNDKQFVSASNWERSIKVFDSKTYECESMKIDNKYFIKDLIKINDKQIAFQSSRCHIQILTIDN